MGQLLARWGDEAWYHCPICGGEHQSRLRLLDGRIPEPGELPVDGLYGDQVLTCYLCRQPMKAASEMLQEGLLILGGKASGQYQR